jgi:hypothetical protein
MTAFLIILVFAVFAALMLARRMPAILAVPAMAIAVAAIVRAPLDQILNHVIANGATRLVEAYLTVFAGAMLGRVVMQTGIAEGSLVRVSFDEEKIVDVGPRSAHIAGLGYVCFTEPEELIDAGIELIQPAPGDDADHVVLRTRSGIRCAITTTCAANLLGYIKPEHFAFGKKESAAIAFNLLAEKFGAEHSPEGVAEIILDVACRKIATTIGDMMAEYHLPLDQAMLIGGGGGAASLAPFTAKLMNLEHRIARNAEVISPIGVAMAMVRDTVERNIVDPSPEDILRVRREAADAAIAAGAVPESVEVEVEVDKRRNLVRATAMGTTELRRREGEQTILAIEQCRESVARSMRIAADAVKLEAETGNHLVFTGRQQTRSFFGLFTFGSGDCAHGSRASIARSGDEACDHYLPETRMILIWRYAFDDTQEDASLVDGRLPDGGWRCRRITNSCPRSSATEPNGRCDARR